MDFQVTVHISGTPWNVCVSLTFNATPFPIPQNQLHDHKVSNNNDDRYGDKHASPSYCDDILTCRKSKQNLLQWSQP